MNCSINGTKSIKYDNQTDIITCICNLYYINESCDVYLLDIDWFYYLLLTLRILIIIIEIFILYWSTIRLIYGYFTNFKCIATYAVLLIMTSSLIRLSLFIIYPYSLYHVIPIALYNFISVLPIFIYLSVYDILLLFWIRLINTKISNKIGNTFTN